jgi:NADH:ubiquinone oxidoreductase subunit
LGKPAQSHSSHVDYYVTKGFQARVALVQGRWQDAVNAADSALLRLTTPILATTDLTKGFSDVNLPSTMWGMEVIPDQASTYWSLYCHLDAKTVTTAYGYNARKCISSWLYDRIGTDDARKQWFNSGSAGTETTGPNVNYGQKKRTSRIEANWVGDFIYMRGEELVLIAAEAYARLGNAKAKDLLKTLAAQRLTTSAARNNYSTYLDGLGTGTSLPAAALDNTNTDPTTVLEEVLLQRRIELWGETGRIKDILRLKQGYERNYADSNHTQMLATTNTNAESGAFLFKIPQKEFDGNKNIKSSEQNPVN